MTNLPARRAPAVNSRARLKRVTPCRARLQFMKIKTGSIWINKVCGSHVSVDNADAKSVRYVRGSTPVVITRNKFLAEYAPKDKMP